MARPTRPLLILCASLLLLAITAFTVGQVISESRDRLKQSQLKLKQAQLEFAAVSAKESELIRLVRRLELIAPPQTGQSLHWQPRPTQIARHFLHEEILLDTLRLLTQEEHSLAIVERCVLSRELQAAPKPLFGDCLIQNFELVAGVSE